MNLGKIRNGLDRYKELFTVQDIQNINDRITTLEQMIEKAPKTLAWKARAAIGTRVQWYNDVEEVERAEHLQNLDD
jgi:flagellar biosynthesis chaperone FliJ